MYYPKSQIKTNLYTDGTEYMLSTTQVEYKGFYYEVSSGKKYTGKTPQDGSNISLVPYVYPYEAPIVSGVNDLSSLINLNAPIETLPVYPIYDLRYKPQNLQSVLPRSIPKFNLTLPTDQDKQNGQFIRYFCTKNNEIRYFEIDKLTYDKLSSRDKQIAWDLYSPASLTWRIKGTQEQVFNSNKGAAISLERNLRWVGFPQYFRDRFLQYYLES